MKTNRKVTGSTSQPETYQKDSVELPNEEEILSGHDEDWGTPEQRDRKHAHLSKTQGTRSTKREEAHGIVIPKPIRKRAWTMEEDETLRHLVEECGAQDWTYIANHFWSRGGKQCRERWHNHLREGITKKPWSE